MARLTVPKLINSKYFKFVVDNYRNEYREEVFNMFKSSMMDSKGVGEGEFSSMEQMQGYLDKSFTSRIMRDCANDKIIGCIMSYPTPLSRSASPVYSGVYFVLHPDYRGKQLQKHLQYIRDSTAIEFNHPLLVARFAITARSLIPQTRGGWQFIGTIPKALKVPKIGWIFDVIGVHDLRPQLTHEELERFSTRLKQIPAIAKYKNNATALQPADELVEAQEVKTKQEERIVIKGANMNEVELVENMIRSCANSGDGFNLDEFSAVDGHYLHKFIIEPKVLVAIAAGDSVLGAAVYGFSALSRVPGPSLAAYFIVNKSARKHGVATALLNVVSELAKQKHCSILLFDLFLNNHVAIEWLAKEGFKMTGSLPSSGYIAEKGYTDSLLMYKVVS